MLLPPPSFIQFYPVHPALSTSNQVISTSTQLQPPSPSSFKPPTSSLKHPQQSLNQNIACNWAISQNLVQKLKSCTFSLKVGTHGILEVLIPNPDLDFGNFDAKIHLSKNWYTWYLKDAESYSNISFQNIKF